MNEQNLEYLKKSLDYLGFGNRLNDLLESAIRRETTKFSLGISQRYTPVELKKDPSVGVDYVNYKLNFSKSKESDMYFLNEYEVTLRKYNDPSLRQHTFDLERDHRMTANQAYKLLAGYALQKEIYSKNGEAGDERSPEKIKVWFKLQQDLTDAFGRHPLKQFYPQYNFDLKETLEKYPLKKLSPLEKDGALKQMSYGNPVQLSMNVDKRTVPVWVAANPKLKTLDVFDEKMQQISEELIFPEKAQERKAQRESGRNATPDQSPDQQERMPWEQDPEMKNNTEISR